MKRAAFVFLAGLAVLLAAVCLAAAAIVFRPELLVRWAPKVLAPPGGTAALRSLEVSLSPLRVALSGLSVAWPGPEGDLLRLERLQVEPIPGRLFRDGPWLRRVEAQGLAFERRRPRPAEGPVDLTPLRRLFDVEELSVTDARLTVALPQGEFSAERLRVGLAPGEGGTRRFEGSAAVSFRRADGSAAAVLSARGEMTPGPSLKARLVLDSGRLAFPFLSGEPSGDASVALSPDAVRVEHFRLVLPAARVDPGGGTPMRLGPVRLEAGGDATLEGEKPRLELRRLDVGGLFLARGVFSGPAPAEMAGTAEGEIPDVGRLVPYLKPYVPKALAGIGLAGGIPWRLDLSRAGREPALGVELLPRDATLSLDGGRVRSRFGGSVRVRGRLSEWRDGKAALAGGVQGTGRAERPPVSVRRFRFDGRLAGTIGAPALPGWSVSVGKDELLYRGRALPLGAVRLKGSVEAGGGAVRVRDAEAVSETVGALRGELGFRAGGFDGRLSGKRLKVEGLVPLALALGGGGATGWSHSGTADVAIDLSPVKGGAKANGAIVLDRLGFGSPGGDVLGQGLACRVDVLAELSARPRIRADLALQRGEALWKTVYVDFSREPLDLHLEGTAAGPSAFETLLLEGGLGTFGRVHAAGKARKEKGTWVHEGRAGVRDARLGTIFRTFLRDPLSASNPGLGTLDLDGVAGVDFAFAGSGTAVRLDGELRLREGEVRQGADPPALSGLEVELPFTYRLGTADPASPAPSDRNRWGRLRLGKAALAGETLGPLEIPVALVPNRLYLGGSVDLPLRAGKVSLERIRVDEPLSAGFRIRMAARADDIDLARLSGDGPFRLEGRLGGTLAPVVVDLERVAAEGALSGDFFGGRIDVDRVTARRPFSAGREVGADIRLDRVDLERFSGALGVGRITGRLSGAVEGLRIAYGQPVAFGLRMESVPVKGVRQVVSLKAVNSISVVGTGSGLGGLGVSLMTTFFREFPYDRIGFACRLNNDVFTVRGLIREEGVEYLVKRRFLTGIDVINGNPDNRIRFTDMVDRTKRVTAGRPE